MTDAYIYIRFSTPKQEGGSSKERQLEACRAMIERKGWHEAGVIEDLGRSAWKGVHLTKGNLGKFAQRIFDGDFPEGTVLVSENLDRFSRQKARVTQRWIEDVCDRGIHLATVAGDKVYSAANLSENLLSILEILFIAEGSNRYIENLVTRVKGSYESRLKQARIDNTAMTTLGPAWLKAVGKRPNVVWEPIPERVRLISEIFDLAIAGQPPWTIARILNERGERSFTGKAWERTSIAKIIRNRAIEGDHEVGVGKNQKRTGEVLVGYYPAIMPLDVVSQARAMLDRRSRGTGRNSGMVNNLFGKKIRCGFCHGRMMLTGYQNRYMTCYEAHRGNVCDHKKSFKYFRFEAAALNEILHLALDDRYFRQAEKSNQLGLQIAAAEKAIRDKKAEAGRLVALLSRIESPSTEAKLVELEAEITKLGTKHRDLNNDLTKAQGASDAQGHLQRVHGVREALSHPDAEVRIPARLRVSEALQGIVDWIRCGIHQIDGEKVVTMSLIGGGHTVVFGNEGEVRWAMRPGSESAPEHFADQFDPPELRQRVGEYFRRLKQDEG